MDEAKTIYHWEDLPFRLDEDEWGKLEMAAEECPGVYYVCLSHEAAPVQELYVVTQDATPAIISQEVVDHGVQTGGVWVFDYQGCDSVYNLVEYEITRYRVKQGLPPEKGHDNLYSISVYAGEFFPWYFGGTIPPRNTPFGLTVRVKKVSEGLFFLETDQCRWVMAVSFPIWNTELSDYAVGLGAFCDDELAARVKESRYLVFPRERCAPAIYELLEGPDHQGLMRFIQSTQVLEAHLWEHFPEYTLSHNANEISGNGKADILENLLKHLGVELPPPEDEADTAEKMARRAENCIAYSKELAGQELLLLP